MINNEIYGQEILRLEFYDYAMLRLEPTSVTIKTRNVFTIESEAVRITYGTTQQSQIHIQANIESNSLKGIADDQNNQVVLSLFNIEFQKFVTPNKEYTKFKFIQ